MWLKEEDVDTSGRRTLFGEGLPQESNIGGAGQALNLITRFPDKRFLQISAKGSLYHRQDSGERGTEHHLPVARNS